MTTHIHFRNDNNRYGVDEAAKQTGDPIPAQGPVLRCRAEIPGGGSVWALSIGNHVFIGSDKHDWWFPPREHPVEEVSSPFVTARADGPAVTKRHLDRNLREDRNGLVDSYSFEDGRAIRSAEPSWHGDRSSRICDIPFAFLRVKITAEDGTTAVGNFRYKQPDHGKAALIAGGPEVYVSSEFHGMARTWKESLAPLTQSVKKAKSHWDFLNKDPEIVIYNRNNPLEVLLRHVGKSRLSEAYPADRWWGSFFCHNFDRKVDDSGVRATMRKKGIKETLERLAKENPVDHTFLLWLFSAKTVDKRKNNALIAAMLEKIGTDYAALLAALQAGRATAATVDLSEYHRFWNLDAEGDRGRVARAVCLSLPGASDAVQEAEAKADWTKRKGNAAQADGLGIDAASFPHLRSAVEAGAIPTGVFHQVNKNPVNVEFPLWEKAFERGWGDTLSSIAKNAAGRSTYERDVTPFIAFLFKIEKFLEKHTGHVWNAVPRFVESQFDLEMDEEDEGDGKATVKRRSALTPVADNEKCIVTVPYVALAVSGVRTQWCYSRHYHLFEEGFTDPVSQGVVTEDLARKLNGRDDYGLCFYTLTGTDTARGYPTFLIIFENLKSGPRVHFHRVRPQRSKDGVPTPACRLVEACYQFMAGNVPAADVAAQQGDLIFIRCPNDPVAAGAKVADPEIGRAFEFESHLFKSESDSRLRMFRSTAKTPQNRLGFLHANSRFRVEHPEHEHLTALSEGWWEIRRCKSWEANPRAIWSRTID